jgi:hypothetical protein
MSRCCYGQDHFDALGELDLLVMFVGAVEAEVVVVFGGRLPESVAPFGLRYLVRRLSD